MSRTRWIVLSGIVAAAGLAVPGVILVAGKPGTIALAQQESTPPAAQAAPGEGEDAARKKKKGRRGDGILVRVDKVRNEPLVQTMPVVGRLVAVRAGVVASRIDAPVEEMKADIGDHVKKGEVLARLVNDRIRWDREQKAAELAAASAAVNTAKSRLALAEQELNRYQELETSAAFPKAAYEDKRLEVARLRTEIVQAQANVERARATLRLAESELTYTRITAPYDGTVTRRHTEIGAFVKEGEPVYTMISDADLEIEAAVPARRIEALSPGDKVGFEFEGGPKFQAEVRAVIPEEDSRTRTRTVRFRPIFNSRPETTAANQSVIVNVPIGKPREVISVHKDALITSRGVPTVFVVEDGRATARQIRIGEGLGGRFEVIEGLAAGEVVVVRGNERLNDGARVRINGAVSQ